MIIVYGTRSGTSDTRLAIPCNNCRQPALVQSDWYQYVHLMFIPTFPVGKQRTVHCEACNNTYETKGSAPIWTFLGSFLFVACLLAGAAREGLRRYGPAASSASITSAASAPAAATSTPTSTSPSASASTPPKAAATRPAASGAASPTTSASSKGRPARPRKK